MVVVVVVGGGGRGEYSFSSKITLWSPELHRDRGRNVKKNKMVFFKNIFQMNGHGQHIA